MIWVMMNITPRTLVSAAVVILLSGLGGQVSAQGTLPECPIGGVPLVACPAINDAIIQGIVAARLSGSIVNSPEDVIRVNVCNGEATLTGQVRGEMAKENAGLLAQSVPGVVSVSNQLLVLPEHSPDIDLVERVRAKLSEALGEFNTVNVYAANGTVQLTGFVYSELERDVAEVAAQSVEGVASVQNNIFVRGSGSDF